MSLSYRDRPYAQPVYDPDLPSKPTLYPRPDPKSKRLNKEAWAEWNELLEIIKDIENNPESKWHGKKECHATHCDCDKCIEEKKAFVRKQNQAKSNMFM